VGQNFWAEKGFGGTPQKGFKSLGRVKGYKGVGLKLFGAQKGGIYRIILREYKTYTRIYFFLKQQRGRSLKWWLMGDPLFKRDSPHHLCGHKQRGRI